MIYDLVMKDGTIVKTVMSGVSEQGDLWIHVVDKSFLECAIIFSDVSKTDEMYVQYDENMMDTFTGYTNLINISFTSNYIKVSLSR